jgi:DNA-binding cell septation regulator SpoVG
VQPQLTIIALSLWLIVFLGLTCVVFALISMWKENRFWLAGSGHHLVHRRHRRLLCRHCSSRRIRSESQIVGEGNTPRGSYYVGLNMQITEITIHPTNEDLVRALREHCLRQLFYGWEIRVMQGPTGLFVSFPAKKQRDGTHRDIAFRPMLKRE